MGEFVFFVRRMSTCCNIIPNTKLCYVYVALGSRKLSIVRRTYAICMLPVRLIPGHIDRPRACPRTEYRSKKSSGALDGVCR